MDLPFTIASGEWISGQGVRVQNTLMALGFEQYQKCPFCGGLPKKNFAKYLHRTFGVQQECV